MFLWKFVFLSSFSSLTLTVNSRVRLSRDGFDSLFRSRHEWFNRTRDRKNPSHFDRFFWEGQPQHGMIARAPFLEPFSELFCCWFFTGFLIGCLLVLDSKDCPPSLPSSIVGYLNQLLVSGVSGAKASIQDRGTIGFHWWVTLSLFCVSL